MTEAVATVKSSKYVRTIPAAEQCPETANQKADEQQSARPEQQI
jgi:hypothetical protein